MAAFDGLLATDEDVAWVAGGDYALVVPRWSTKAMGTDGNFSALARWELGSASTPFDQRGIVPGHICVLGKESSVKAEEVLGVAAVVSNAVTLKRVGQAPGEGDPPGPTAGAVNQPYRFPTCEPMLRVASREVRRSLRIKDDAWMEAASDLTQAVVLYVLAELYDAQWRDMGNSSWRSKAKEKRGQLEDIILNLNRTYGIEAPGRRAVYGTLTGNDPAPNVTPLGVYFRPPRVGD